MPQNFTSKGVAQMRRLTKSEGKLLITILVIIFIFANMAGIKFLTEHKRRLSNKLVLLKGEESFGKEILAEEPLWTERRNWIAAAQPHMKASGDVNSAELLEALQTSATAHKVVTADPIFLGSTSKPEHQEFKVGLKATGTLEAMMKWIAELQQPKNFQAITFFSLKSDAEPSKVKCELQVVRYFANPS